MHQNLLNVEFASVACYSVTLFLSFWLVQNLSCDPEQSEGFPTSGNDTENKYSISDALRSLPQSSSLSIPINMNTIMIITGESSGELYGSLLAKALKSKWPDVHIIGVGGERMNEAGVELISRTSDAFGLIEAVSAYRRVKAAFDKTVDIMKKVIPDVLVLIDYPDFNLKVAKVAKSLGIKILYYVSPQVWAWRKGRIKKIVSLVDRMAVILPFEEEIYKNTGVPCEFVGHPILEEIESVLQSSVNSHQSLTDNPPIPPLAKGGKGGFKATLGFDPV